MQAEWMNNKHTMENGITYTVLCGQINCWNLRHLNSLIHPPPHILTSKDIFYGY